MSTNKNPIFSNSVLTQITEFNNANGTGQLPIFTATADGGSLLSLVASSTDTVAATATISISDGTNTVAVLGAIAIPAGAGSTAVVVDLMPLLEPTGLLQTDGSLGLGAGTITVVAELAVAPSAGAGIGIFFTAFGGNYAE